MATVGTLANDMAHSFNHIVGTILGYAELALDEVSYDHPVYRHMQRILTAGNRAKELVQRLLACGQQNDLMDQPAPLPLSHYPGPPGQSGVPLPRGHERILLADDEEAIIHVWQRMLESHGYTVQICTSGSEALAAFAATPEAFDLVIADQTMPHLTGEALAFEIHRMRPEIPIILCTGLSHSMSQDQAAALGIRALVMKPLTLQGLSQVIRQVLAQSRGQ